MLPVENINNATFYPEKKTDVTFPRKGDKKSHLSTGGKAVSTRIHH
jgi:hypothetical protein